MAGYIDVDKFADAICIFPAIDEQSACAVISLLRRQSTADVAEVVRCGKCKHSFNAGMSGMYCEHPDNIMPLGCNPDDFCSYGERKEEK